MATHFLGDWQEVVSGDGSVYYHNVVTNETSWDLPSDTLPADSSYDNGGDAPQDEDDRLHDEDEDEVEDDGASAYDESVLINGEWSEVFDERSQSYYYHNVKTDETTWDRPIEINPVAIPAKGGDEYFDAELDDGLRERIDVQEQQQQQQQQQQELGEPQTRGPSIIPDTPVRDLDPDIAIADIAKMFGSIYMEEFVEQNFNFARKGIFKARQVHAFALFFIFFLF